MRERYASASTYQDRGRLRQTLTRDSDGDAQSVDVTFETLFDRQTGAFRFEYTEHAREHRGETRRVSWRSRADATLTWWSVEPEKIRTNTLPEALGIAAGVSHGLSCIVPRLLLPFGGSRRRTYEVAGVERVDGRTCDRLASERPNDIETLWIESDEPQLLRHEQRVHHVDPVPENVLAHLAGKFPPEELDKLRHPEPFWSVVTIDYQPVFDVPIEADRFAFTPPTTP